jgi:integrase
LVKPLTDPQCASAKPKEKDYSMFDGDGLILLIRTSGTKTWRYRYKNSLGTQIITIGTYPAIKLAKAREYRAKYQTMIANELDPKEQIAIEQSKQDNKYHFEPIARAWHVAYKASGKWSEETADRALKNLIQYVFPVIGTRSIDSIKPKDLNLVLSQIEDMGFLEVVKKTRQRFVSIFAYAISKGLIELNPASSLKDAITVTRKTKHHPKLHPTRLTEFLQKIDADKGYPITKLCLIFTLHTFTRSSEVRFARWSEFDLEKGQWLIPPERQSIKGSKYAHRGAKMKTEHLIILSPQVLTILKEIQTYSGMYENVFPKHGDPYGFISESTINNTLRRMGYDTNEDVCLHGFRGMACGALVESMLFTEEAVEKQMSHQERDQVRLAYTHHVEFLDERKKMMYWWSDYLDKNRDGYISAYEYAQQIKLIEQDNLIQFKKV